MSEQQHCFDLIPDNAGPYASEVNHYVLDLSVFLKRVSGHVLTMSAVFAASVGHFRREARMIVDPDCTELELIGDSYGTAHILRPNASG